ncbi:HNH endonuclease [Vibrio parahaemolyticus]|uniref:HNH endonuclease n=1 Tax=Vibrio parahaemolyticus TaxID=670 RepID=UPI000418642C|nr:HNH endonuclease signature motif containing protein [Vibrio parahaemolyticus]HCE2690165.1 HNH endonuclease [Vibrio parahaemolyticus]HCE2915288.1 HNH endonuclease [Vibrio parahaemolyticus]HCG8557182.1 HNH endonuclease [Vibrio parahaemolyticus]HCH0054402.1 HNH endonuclease [Vibrio parahaemolyticus]HCH1887463.1 HNH endonuclease [Vibrio parahaemolyticus]
MSKYSEQIHIALAELVFDIYLSNYKQGISTLYSISLSSNKEKISSFADRVGMSRGTAENYSERLFNFFNELNGFDLHNGLGGCTKQQREAGLKVFNPRAFQMALQSQLSLEESLENRISKSKKSTSLERQKRIEAAGGKPKRIKVVATYYIRNPDVIVETLARANGYCERCKNKAPFLRRTDRSPYLEVHHIIPLSEGGDDLLENTIALCPNCHRDAHFGL